MPPRAAHAAGRLAGLGELSDYSLRWHLCALNGRCGEAKSRVLLQRGKQFRGPGALGADHTSQYRRHEIQLRSAYVACRFYDNSSTAWHGFIASHFLSLVPGAKLQ